eukprot:27696-Amphidinium_carterae.1
MSRASHPPGPQAGDLTKGNNDWKTGKRQLPDSEWGASPFTHTHTLCAAPSALFAKNRLAPSSAEASAS